MVGYDVELRGVDEQLRKLRRFEEISNRHFARSMSDNVKAIARVTRRLAPDKSGQLAAGVDHEVLVQGEQGVVGRVIDDYYTSLWVEFGTQPHGVSSEVFEQNYGTDRHTAFLLARRIKASGAGGSHFMYRAFKSLERLVLRNFEQAVDRITAELQT